MSTVTKKGDARTHDGRWFGLRPWGRHGLVLAVAGMMYIFLGLMYYYVVPEGPRWEALVVAREMLPLRAWAFLWAFIGVMTLISSRWPPTADKWGYMVLTGWTAGWGGVYAMGVIFEGTHVSNLAGAALFWQLAFMWWAISGLSNPKKIIVQIVEVADNAGQR